jgi:hypothetical protein
MCRTAGYSLLESERPDIATPGAVEHSEDILELRDEIEGFQSEHAHLKKSRTREKTAYKLPFRSALQKYLNKRSKNRSSTKMKFKKTE